ncbi:hypothetical protein GGI11_003954 [Coemansia sp. RSA 2049]|nr:hypothetical protein GGI11_003954 [Coemansia sp. RSA 2049]
MTDNKGKHADADADAGAALQAAMPVIAELLERGTRAFALGTWAEAIDSFGELAAVTEQTFGSGSQRYADCLVMYGRALLQHAVEQSALLAQRALADAAAATTTAGGGSSKSGGGDKKKKEDEEQEDQDAVEGAPAKRAKFSFEGEPDFRQVEGLGPGAEEKEKEEDGASGKAGEGASSKGNGKAVDEQQQQSDEDEESDENEKEGEEEEEDDDDFAAAWDVLDVARVIQAKATDRKSRLKYAETLMLLGDVSMESENFAQAATDFAQALEVKRQYLGNNNDDSRELAELYYKVALAHEYNRDTRRALELMADVERILGNCLASLEASADAKDREEAAALRDVLADVAEKVREWRAPPEPAGLGALSSEEAALAEKAKAMFKQALEAGTINDISGLIKKKNNNNKSKAKDEAPAEESHSAGAGQTD